MPFAPVNGQRLFFEDGGGDKPVVVLSHGNLMNRWMWAPQIEALRAEFRCLVWDERLHGHTEDDRGLYTYWDSAADLLGLMDHLDIDRAALVGHSQGGFLALRAALLAPERVTALVLIDTAGWPGRPRPWLRCRASVTDSVPVDRMPLLPACSTSCSPTRTFTTIGSGPGVSSPMIDWQTR